MPHKGLIPWIFSFKIFFDHSRSESRNGHIFLTLAIQATQTHRLSNVREKTSNRTAENGCGEHCGGWLAARAVESSPPIIGSTWWNKFN